jgi:hypothetical protein
LKYPVSFTTLRIFCAFKFKLKISLLEFIVSSQLFSINWISYTLQVNFYQFIYRRFCISKSKVVIESSNWDLWENSSFSLNMFVVSYNMSLESLSVYHTHKISLLLYIAFCSNFNQFWTYGVSALKLSKHDFFIDFARGYRRFYENLYIKVIKK